MPRPDLILAEPGSCFIDSCALAMGLPAKIIKAFIEHHFPEANCPVLGYHPTYVNVACLELYQIGIAQVDPCPVDYSKDGGNTRQQVTDRVSAWFKRPDFRCVVTGPHRENGAEHANAWVGGAWIDPAKIDEAFPEPTVAVRSLWLTTLVKEKEPDTASVNTKDEASDD